MVLEGAHAQNVDDTLLIEFGATLALLQKAWAGITVTSTRGWMNLRLAEASLTRLTPDSRPTIEQVLRSSRHIFDNDLPRRNIHGDLHLFNLFAAEGKVTTVFDFEDAENNLRIVDIASCARQAQRLNGFRFDHALELVTIGFQRHETLTDEEHAFLPDACRYVSGAAAAWYLIHGRADAAESTLESLNELSKP